jgi:hypothetical protein
LVGFVHGRGLIGRPDVSDFLGLGVGLALSDKGNRLVTNLRKQCYQDTYKTAAQAAQQGTLSPLLGTVPV